MKYVKEIVIIFGIRCRFPPECMDCSFFSAVYARK